MWLPLAKKCIIAIRTNSSSSNKKIIIKTILKKIVVFVDPRVYYARTYGSKTATLWTSNEEIDDIMKIIWSLEDSGSLIKDVTQTIENEKKEKNKEEDFLVCYSENWVLVY